MLSTYSKLGIPDALAIGAVIVAFILSMAPYAAGYDFGIFKVPSFPLAARKKLRIYGPLMLVLTVSFFVPIWNNSEERPSSVPQVSGADLFMGGKPVERAIVYLFDRKTGRQKQGFIKPEDNGRFSFAGLQPESSEIQIAIDIEAPVDYLPFVWKGRLSAGGLTKIELSPSDCMEASPMVKIPAGFLYRGIRDNSFSVELLRKFHRLKMQFSELAGPGPTPIDIDLDTLMEIINIEPREVRLPAFDIDVHEVTNAEYRKFLDAAAKDRAISHPDEPADKDRTPRSWSKAVSGKFTLDKPNQPATGIDFFDAYAFAQWSGKRLPPPNQRPQTAG